MERLEGKGRRRLRGRGERRGVDGGVVEEIDVESGGERWRAGGADGAGTTTTPEAR